MTYEQLCNYFGSLARTAEVFDVPRQTAHQWKGRRVPTIWQLRACEKTGGKLRPDKQALREAQEMAGLLQKAA